MQKCLLGFGFTGVGSKVSNFSVARFQGLGLKVWRFTRLKVQGLRFRVQGLGSTCKAFFWTSTALLMDTVLDFESSSIPQP